MKAQYICREEELLYKDLIKVNERIRTLANWYFSSNYDSNLQDRKNKLIYTHLINNIYHNFEKLLSSTEEYTIESNLKSIIIDNKLTSISDVEQLLQDIRIKDIKNVEKDIKNIKIGATIKIVNNHEEEYYKVLKDKGLIRLYYYDEKDSIVNKRVTWGTPVDTLEELIISLDMDKKDGYLTDWKVEDGEV